MSNKLGSLRKIAPFIIGIALLVGVFSLIPSVVGTTNNETDIISLPTCSTIEQVISIPDVGLPMCSTITDDEEIVSIPDEDGTTTPTSPDEELITIPPTEDGTTKTSPDEDVISIPENTEPISKIVRDEDELFSIPITPPTQEIAEEDELFRIPEIINITNKTTIVEEEDELFGIAAVTLTESNLIALNSSNQSQTIFNSTTIETIEMFQINITFVGAGNLDTWIFNYTANGTDSCALGNKQYDRCYNITNSFPYQWITFKKAENTTTFNPDRKKGGDAILWEEQGSGTDVNITLYLDEHYNPNIAKHYGALFDFNDQKIQNATDQRITKNQEIKVEFPAGNIPTDAREYKIDIRVSQSSTAPSQPLFAHLCNSTYVTVNGSPEDYSGCILVAEKTASELTDAGGKFRGLFTNNTLAGIGDIEFLILDTDEVNPNRFYAIDTYKILNSSYTQTWEYSDDGGSTWSNLADDYESTINVNWFHTDTAFTYKFWANDSNGDTQTIEGGFNWSTLDEIENLPPLIELTDPAPGDNISFPHTVTFISSDPNADELNLTLLLYKEDVLNSTLFTNQNQSNTSFIWSNNSAFGFYNLTLLGCEKSTADKLCTNITHRIGIFDNCTIVNSTQLTGHLDCSGNLTIESFGELNTSTFNVTAAGDVVVAGDLNGGTGQHSFGSLTINSGGTYNATSGTTTITSEDSNGEAFDCDGTFTANSGLVNITTTADTKIDLGCTGNLYDLEIATGTSAPDNTRVWGGGTIDNDLTISSGLFTANTAGNAVPLDVTGDVVVTGTLDLNPSGTNGDHSFGSLTINSGGTYNATSGTTTINNRNAAAEGMNLNSGGTFTHNNGEVDFTYGLYQAVIGNITFFDLSVTKGPQYEARFANNVTVENILKCDGWCGTTGGAVLNVSGNITVIDNLGGAGNLPGTPNAWTFIANNLTVNSGGGVNLPTGTGTTTISGDVVTSGELRGHSGTHSFGSLTINSGGHYNASSGTTTLTSRTSSGWAWDVASGGTFTHNNGTISFSSTGGLNKHIIDQNGLLNFYNFDTTGSDFFFLRTATLIDNNLTINSSATRGLDLQISENNPLNVTGDTVINSGMLWGRASAVRFGSLTIGASGTYNATSGTTTILGNTIINSGGLFQTPATATPPVVNVTNVTHDGTTNTGNATWHLYGEWKGTGTLNAYQYSNTTKLIAYNGSKIMGTLTGYSRYVYHFVIPDGATVTKYGSQTFMVYGGYMEINGTFAFNSGSRRLATGSLNDEGDITFGSNGNVSQMTWVPIGNNKIPESTWYSIYLNNAGTQTLLGNLTLAGANIDDLVRHYSASSFTALNLSGYTINVTGSNHNLKIGNSLYTSGYTGKVYLDGGTITGYENITIYTDTSFIQDSGSGSISAKRLNLSYGNINLTGTDLTFTGDVIVNDTFIGGTGQHSFGSLTINSGGTYNATNGTTTLTSETTGGTQLDIQSGGTFTHNNGLVKTTYSVYSLWQDADETANVLYDAQISDGTISIGGTSQSFSIENNLTIDAGKKLETYNTMTGLTVGGDVSISGTLDANRWSDGPPLNFGTLTIESGGTYDATSGITNMSGNTSVAGTIIGNKGNYNASPYNISIESGGIVSNISQLNVTLLNITGAYNMSPSSEILFTDAAGAGFGKSSGSLFAFGNWTDRINITSASKVAPTNRFSGFTEGKVYLDYATFSYGGGTLHFLQLKSGDTWSINNTVFDSIVTTGANEIMTFTNNIPNAFNNVTMSNCKTGRHLLSSAAGGTGLENVDLSINNSKSNNIVLAANIRMEFNNSNFDITDISTSSTGIVASSNHNDVADSFMVVLAESDTVLSDEFTTDPGSTDNLTLIIEDGGTTAGVFQLNADSTYNTLNISPTTDLDTDIANDRALTVTSDTTVSGNLTGQASAISLGSLTINSGAIYNATTQTTTITSERSDGYAYVEYGGLVHNNGLIKITTGTHTNIYGTRYDKINNLEIDMSGYTCSLEDGGDNDILGDITVTAGTFDLNTRDLDVAGDVNVSGTLSATNGAIEFGSLTINSGGTYDATSGTTTIVGTALNPTLNIDNDGAFTHNSGKLNITAQNKTINTGNSSLYDLEIAAIAGNNITLLNNTDLEAGLNVSSGTLDTNTSFGHRLAVSGDVAVTGTLHARNASNITFGSLDINSGGVYNATTGTTTITSEASSGYAFDNEGVLTHNNGLIKFTYTASGVDVDFTGTSGNAYDLEVDTSTRAVRQRATAIADNNLTITSGTWNTNGQPLTVTGDASITGTLTGSTQDHSLGSLTIYSAGTYSASTGITTITANDSAGHAIMHGGTWTHNSGLVNITNTNNMTMNISGTGNLFDLEIATNGYNITLLDDTDLDGGLNITSGILDTNTTDNNRLAVSRDVIINGALHSRRSNNITFGSLDISAAGIYNATNETTTITANNSGGMVLNSSGTFTHNKGRVYIIASGATSIAVPAANIFYDLDYDSDGNGINMSTGFEVENNLNVSAGAFDTNTQALNVTGDIYIYGALNGSTANHRFGSLTINQSTDRYIATSGTTNITNGSFINKGNFTHNSGTVEFANNSYIVGINATYSFNDLVIDANTNVTVLSENVNASGDVTINGILDTHQNALEFAGENNFTVPDDTSLDITNNFTAEFWAKSDAWGSVLLNYKEDVAYGTGFDIRYTGGRIALLSRNPYTQTNGPGLLNGTWYHIAVTYDGETQRFYVDGIETSSDARTGSIGTNNNPIELAKNAGNTDRFNGTIDEFRVYNRTLSAQEIKEHYHNLFSNETGLVLYLPFDEGSGQVAGDKSGLANNGNLGSQSVIDSRDPTWVAVNTSFGSLTANSGSTFNATSGTTTLTSESAFGYAFDIINAEFTHNNGRINITTPTNTTIYIPSDSENLFYDLEIATGTFNVTLLNNTIVEGGLNVSSGVLDNNDVVDYNLTVHDEVIIEGKLYGWNSINVTFGSLIIEDTGKYLATTSMTEFTNLTKNSSVIGNFSILNGTIRNLRINSTQFNITGGADIEIHDVTAWPAALTERVTSGKYVNITNTSATSSMLVNMSFIGWNPSNMLNINLYKYNTTWYNVTDATVDRTNNWTSCNLTYFSKLGIMEVNDNTGPATMTLVNPSLENDTRNINNTVVINATVVDAVSGIDVCIIEWQDQNMTSSANITMTKESLGASISCNYTNSTLIDGTNYTYRVHANDSFNNWNVTETRTFKENTVPNITRVVLTPATTYGNENLNCTVITAEDAEHDVLTYYYEWYYNGVLNVTVQNTTDNMNQMFSGTTAGDSWQCTIISHDGYENGTSFSDSVTISERIITPPSGTGATPQGVALPSTTLGGGIAPHIGALPTEGVGEAAAAEAVFIDGEILEEISISFIDRLTEILVGMSNWLFVIALFLLLTMLAFKPGRSIKKHAHKIKRRLKTDKILRNYLIVLVSLGTALVPFYYFAGAGGFAGSAVLQTQIKNDIYRWVFVISTFLLLSILAYRLNKKY